MAVRPRKQFGQHWLRSDRALNQIIKAAALDPDDRVLEIGPGKGVLTHRLLAIASEVIAVEIDRDLCELLRQKFAQTQHFLLLERDFLDVDLLQELTAFPSFHTPNKVVANIPYNITGPILEKLLGTIAASAEFTGFEASGIKSAIAESISTEPAPAIEQSLPQESTANPWISEGNQSRSESELGRGTTFDAPAPIQTRLQTTYRPDPLALQTIVLLLQKEVAERLCARPGRKAFGALSVRTQYLADCEWICDVPSTAFYPQPKVDSAVVRLTPRLIQPPAHNPRHLDTLVRLGFATKRKMLRNNLTSVVEREQLSQLLEALNLSPQVRAEEISVAEWVALSNRLLQESSAPSSGALSSGALSSDEF